MTSVWRWGSFAHALIRPALLSGAWLAVDVSAPSRKRSSNLPRLASALRLNWFELMIGV